MNLLQTRLTLAGLSLIVTLGAAGSAHAAPADVRRAELERARSAHQLRLEHLAAVRELESSARSESGLSAQHLGPPAPVPPTTETTVKRSEPTSSRISG